MPSLLGWPEKLKGFNASDGDHISNVLVRTFYQFKAKVGMNSEWELVPCMVRNWLVLKARFVVGGFPELGGQICSVCFGLEGGFVLVF